MRPTAYRSAFSTHGHYEYRVLTFSRDVPGGDARQVLTDEAEYGRWELARTRIAMGGERRVTLRRRVIRARSTL